MRCIPFSLIFLNCLGLFAACNTTLTESRYRGYKKVIDVDNIKSVTRKQQSKIADIKIPEADSTTFNYTSYLKNVRYVKLETTAASKVRTISKMLFTADRIILVDYNVSKAVYIFDTAGHFINKIVAGKKYGKANKYMQGFLEVAIDHNANEIILHDQTACKSFYFDVNGNFLNVSKEYVYFVNVANIKNTDQFAYINQFGGNPHVPALTNSSLYFGKKNTEIKYTATDALSNMKTGIDYRINLNPSFTNSNNRIFYTPEYSDTVYEIAGNPLNIYPKLVMHYPGPDIYSKLRKDQKEGIFDFNKLKNKNQYYSFEGEIFCNDDSVYHFTTYKKNIACYFYSEETGNIIGGQPVLPRLKDSVEMEIYRYPVTSWNQYFVSLMFPDDFVNTKYLKTSKLMAVEKNTKPTDNPILVFYQLNKF